LPDCRKEFNDEEPREKKYFAVRGLEKEEISDFLAKLKEKSFRGDQVFRWVQAQAVQSWAEMTNLSVDLQEKLASTFSLVPLKLVQEQVSRDGTRKYLWELVDGQRIESVLLFHAGDFTRKRTTLCLSTQVGCPMGCGFCATGKLGFTRNLTVGEIVSQVLDLTALQRHREGLRQEQFKINNLVYMGMGEPLLNLPVVLKSIKLLNYKDGQNIGIRRITISTCGLVPQIDQLAAAGLDFVLAVSLHAPNNELRNRIMPINRQYPLEKLLNACRRYIKQTGQRITFEYVLIKGFNDSLQAAAELAALLRGMKANLNVIPVNTIGGRQYQRPSFEDIQRFVSFLQEKGIAAVLREEKGSDIAGACGQLAGGLE
jgi:23S rRNA (adenine2503-C2)-methyltransferase